MLRPTKHSHPDRTVINVSLLLLARLKARRVDEYDVLRTLKNHFDPDNIMNPGGTLGFDLSESEKRFPAR